MADVPAIHVGPEHWRIVSGILQDHVASYEVWAFGSRAQGTPKRHSDLDLAVITEQPLPLAVLSRLAESFSESDLPWKVDVLDWATTSDAFRCIVARDKVVVQRPTSAACASR